MLPLTQIVIDSEKTNTYDILVPMTNVLFMQRTRTGTLIHFNMLTRSYLEDITVRESLEQIQELLNKEKA